MIGETVSHYRILEKIGGGGMGTVYKAEDVHLLRPVALKFLHPVLIRADDANDRFLREARAASSLDHPNICTIFEIDVTEEGHLFMAMAYYEGETLRDRLEGSPLSVEEAVEYARQIARGLDHAHRRNIVHRDVKPSNILIAVRDTEPEASRGPLGGIQGGKHSPPVFDAAVGLVKILDFGIAKIVEEPVTLTGHPMGTPTYMAPEQIHGQTGPASDMWSLGVVLYEMLTGQRPFGNHPSAALLKILQEDPSPLKEHRSDAPPEVQRVLDRMLAKDPARRFASAAELAEELEATIAPTPVTAGFLTRTPARGKAPTATTLQVPVPRMRPAAWAVVLVAAAVLLLAVLYLVPERESSLTDVVAADAVVNEALAVLPFSFRGSPEHTYLGEGMVDLLATKLDGSGRLRSVDPRALLSHLSRGAARTGDEDPQQAVAIAEHFGARRFVLGNVVELAGNLRLDASLYRAEDGRALKMAQASSEGVLGDLFGLVDDLAAQLLVAELDVADVETARLAAVTTDSFTALKHYLEGESTFRQGRFAPAEAALRRAVEEDPEFALAWYRLSVVGEWQFDNATALESAAQAVRHAGRLSERHRRLVGAMQMLKNGDHLGAEPRYLEILERYPEDMESWFNLGEIAFHCAQLDGRSLRDATDPWLRVLELEPDHQLSVLHLIRIFYYARRHEELADLVERLGDSLMASTGTDNEVLLMRTVLEDPPDRAETAVRAGLRARPVRSIQWLLMTGAIFATDRPAMDLVRARVEILTQASRPANDRALGHRYVAVIDVVLGRMAAARQGFARAAELVPSYIDELEPLLLTLPFYQAPRGELEAMRSALEQKAPAQSPDAVGGALLTLQPHTLLGAHLRAYQLGLLAAALDDAAGAEDYALELEALGGAAGIPSLGRELAAGVRAELARRDGRFGDVLEALDPDGWPCSYQLALGTPLVSRVRERYLRAEALEAAGRLDEALGFYGSLTETGIYDLVYLAPGHLRRARIFQKLGREDEARRHREIARELWSGSEPGFEKPDRVPIPDRVALPDSP